MNNEKTLLTIEQLEKITGMEADLEKEGKPFRMHYDGETISTMATEIGYNAWRTMEKKIREFEIVQEKYTVYTWNDISGWLYWKEQSEEYDVHGMNYIQISAVIHGELLTEDEAEQLNDDIQEAFGEFERYDYWRMMQYGGI